MKTTLSVFLNIDRIYFTVIEETKKGLELLHIDSTDAPFDLDFPDSQESQVAAQELEFLFSEFTGKITNLSVTLPVENVLVSQIPIKKDFSLEQIKQLVSLEIRQSYPQFDYRSFSSEVIPLLARRDGKQFMLAIMIQNTHVENCRSLLKFTGLEIDNLEIAQIVAHTSFVYNYPELEKSTVALLGIQNQFLDVSVMTDGKPTYYNVVSFNDKNLVSKLCETEIDKINSLFAEDVDYAYLFGQGLTESLLHYLKSSLSGFVSTVDRFNAFRMMKCDLTKRLRDYCSRTAHIYPPCIGGCLPSVHEKIMLF